MNKAELTQTVAEKIGVAKKQVEDILEAMLETIIATLKQGGEVNLTGFGAFLTRRREGRLGVNPQNPQEKIQIPAVTVPKFKAGKNLKDALKSPSTPPAA